MHYNLPKKSTAFTMIEVIVATAILSTIIMTVLLLLIKITHSYYTSIAINELSSAGSLALDELTNELRESSPDMIMITSLQDPLTVELHDMIAFATARDSAGVFQKNSVTGFPIWQGVIVYYPFRTADGINQMRKYAYYDILTDVADFPLTISVTANAIDLSSASALRGALVSINRTTDATRVLANNIATEDQDLDQALDANENDGAISQPPDNADGVLDTGINYTQVNRIVTAKLFMRKQISIIGGLGQRFVTITLNTAVALRN